MGEEGVDAHFPAGLEQRIEQSRANPLPSALRRQEVCELGRPTKRGCRMDRTQAAEAYNLFAIVGDQERIAGRGGVPVGEEGLTDLLVRIRRRARADVVVEDGRDRGPVIRSDGTDCDRHGDMVSRVWGAPSAGLRVAGIRT